jgi:hypothetical protein
MEGVGIRKILDQMKRDNITLKYYSHDDDSCSRSLIREYFPKALEYLDIGHAAKNIKKKIIEAGRNTEYHQLRGFGERMQRDFRFLVKKYHKDPKILSYQIMNMADHYSGKHSNCDHEAFTAKYNTLSCPNTIKYMSNILSYYSDRATHFKEGRLTNTAESINRMVVSFTSKNIDEPVSYPIGANFAALLKNEGVFFQKIIFDSFGVGLSGGQLQKIEVKNTKRERSKDQKKKQGYSLRKQKNKEKKKRNKPTNPKYFYKDKGKRHCSECRKNGVVSVDHDKRTCKRTQHNNPPLAKIPKLVENTSPKIKLQEDIKIENEPQKFIGQPPGMKPPPIPSLLTGSFSIYNRQYLSTNISLIPIWHISN